MLAIFDTNAGFLQWVGEAKDHEAAIKALRDDVGLYEASADRADVEATAEEDSLCVIEVTDDQAAVLRVWASHGFRASDYPDGLSAGVNYSKGEVLKFLDSWSTEKKLPISVSEMDSMQAAQKIAEQKETVVIANPAVDKKFEGKVIGVTAHHVVVSLGRSAVIVDMQDVDQVPAAGENVKLAFVGGKGVFEVSKGVGVER